MVRSADGDHRRKLDCSSVRRVKLEFAGESFYIMFKYYSIQQNVYRPNNWPIWAWWVISVFSIWMSSSVVYVHVLMCASRPTRTQKVVKKNEISILNSKSLSFFFVRMIQQFSWPCFLGFVLLPVLIIIYEKGLHLFAAVNIFTFTFFFFPSLQLKVTTRLFEESSPHHVAVRSPLWGAPYLYCKSFSGLWWIQVLWCHSRGGDISSDNPGSPNREGPPTESEAKCVLCFFMFTFHFYFILKCSETRIKPPKPQNK